MNRREVEDYVVRAAEKFAEPRALPIRMSDTPASIGADSLDSVEILCLIEEDLGVALTDQLVENLSNLGSLVDCVCKELSIQ